MIKKTDSFQSKSDYIKLSEYLKTNQLQIGDTVTNSIGMASMVMTEHQLNIYKSKPELYMVKLKPIFI